MNSLIVPMKNVEMRGMGMAELQRCPNCGCQAWLTKTKRNSFWRFKYECIYCWAETDLHYSEEDARAEWNRLEKRSEDDEDGK